MKQEISDVHHDNTINWELKDVPEQNGKNQQKLTINIVQPGEWPGDQQSVQCSVMWYLQSPPDDKQKTQTDSVTICWCWWDGVEEWRDLQLF